MTDHMQKLDEALERASVAETGMQFGGECQIIRKLFRRATSDAHLAGWKDRDRLAPDFVALTKVERALKAASRYCDAPAHNPHKIYNTETETMWCPECVKAGTETLEGGENV